MIRYILGALLLIATSASSLAESNYLIGESESLNGMLTSVPYRATSLVNFSQTNNAWGNLVTVNYWKQQGTNRLFAKDEFMAPTQGTGPSNFRWRFDPASGVLQISPENGEWANGRAYPLHSPVLGAKQLRFRVFGSDTVVTVDRRHDYFPEIFYWWEDNIADARQGQSILIDISAEALQGTISLGGVTPETAGTVVLQVSVNDLRPGLVLAPNPLVVNDYN